MRRGSRLEAIIRKLFSEAMRGDVSSADKLPDARTCARNARRHWPDCYQDWYSLESRRKDVEVSPQAMNLSSSAQPVARSSDIGIELRLVETTREVERCRR